jgi:MoxR-like ATPase
MTTEDSDTPVAAATDNSDEIVARVSAARDTIQQELRKAVIGQNSVIEELIIALFTGGHCLMTGVPGLGKTLLVRSIAEVFSLSFKRIQFTPDLMPADICGTEIVEEDAATGKRTFSFVRGPVFANIVLADEINRTPPKTQAALLEAMEERQVTAGSKTYTLERPFFVLATQNPIELEGTYPLPEAQLDRFVFNVVLDYLSTEDEEAMVSQTTNPEAPQLQTLFDGDEITRIQGLVRQVPAASNVVSYAVRLVNATRPSRTSYDYAGDNLKWGAGSRASQALVLTGKARALLHGRYCVACEDIQALAPSVLRHRLLTNFRADAEGITTEDIIQHLLETVPVEG